MNSENTFWILLWSLVALVLVVVVSGGYLYNANQDRLINEQVLKGVDPIKAACSFHQHSDVCKMVAAKPGV